MAYAYVVAEAQRFSLLHSYLVPEVTHKKLNSDALVKQQIFVAFKVKSSIAVLHFC